MVQITVTPDSIRIKGHANYAEYGKDIVCSAVSCLTTGSAKIWRVRGDVFVEQVSESEVFFKFTWTSENKDLLNQVSFLKSHYKLLAQHYPDYVSYSE